MPGGELPRVAPSMPVGAGGHAGPPAMQEIVVDHPGRCSSESQPSPVLPSAVIHELRTPLTSIHGYAQVLQRNLRGEPRAANALSVVVRESTRLSAMLASLSELAELEARHEPPPAVRVRTEDIVGGVVHDVMRRDSQAHPIKVAGSGVACCDPTDLSQALVHILTNAVRYSEAGEPVEVTIREEPARVIIEVADRGIGMENGDQQRLYGRFERGSLARQAGIRGLGLGLFLAREALRQHGGYLDHEARPGGGTVFRVTLPRG